MACLAISAADQRANATPDVAGSSHASALTSATCAGGKTPRSTRPRSLLEPVNAFLAEPFSPLRYRLARLIEPRRDLGVGHAVGRVQDRLRAHDIAMRTRVRRRASLKLATLLVAEDHRVWRLACHRPPDSPPRRKVLQASAGYLRRRPLSLDAAASRATRSTFSDVEPSATARRPMAASAMHARAHAARRERRGRARGARAWRWRRSRRTAARRRRARCPALGQAAQPVRRARSVVATSASPATPRGEAA